MTHVLPKVLSRGCVREDGKVFMGYIRSGTREWWSTPEQLEKEKSRCRKVSKKWRERHPDYSKQYYFKNRDLCKANWKEWRRKNPEKAKKQWVEYKKKHAKEIRIKEKQKRKENPHKVCEKAAKRRALVSKSRLMISRDQRKIMECVYEISMRISKYIGIKHHVDHIIPLSKGGYHIHTNLQVIPVIINLKKAAKI